ncbi:MAG TPA: iron-sulfur cluster assembly scaffold protein [Candidatus Bipolaricaulota bacterium]|nr:iron-sulfur cluster assembly scaffold protein [Candidatus Bipolaricaulota bacterium]
MYSKKVLEHFTNPHNQGTIDDADAVGEAGNMRCGDIMKIYLKIKDDKIDDIKFETLGCAAAIATSSIMTDLVKGKTLEDALKVTDKDIVDSLGDLPPVKYHCSILATKALKDGIDKYRVSGK